MSDFITSTSTITSVAVTVPNLTGGTNGKVVRMSGTNQVTDAANSDTATQLNTVMFKVSDVYYSSGYLTGFSGLNPGSVYYLSTAGNITASPPTPTSSVRVLLIGFAVNTTDLVFRPGIPISGS